MPIPPAVRAVFFDAVGTLLHPEPPAAVVYAAAARRLGSRLDVGAILPRFRAAFRQEEELDRQNGFRTSEAREVERWQRIVGHVLDDVSDADACFRELFEHFSRPEAWRLDADAAATLAELARRGYVLGLASNYDRRLRRVVAGLPPLQGLRHLVISSEVGWRKPAAGFFEVLCRTTELPPEAVALVGDDWENDYEGARQAGLRAVLLDPRGRCASVAERVTCLSDLVR